MAYEGVTGPLGPERLDLLHALQTAVLVSPYMKKKPKPKDFLPVWDQNRKQSPEEMLAALKAITAMHGGTYGDHSEPPGEAGPGH